MEQLILRGNPNPGDCEEEDRDLPDERDGDGGRSDDDTCTPSVALLYKHRLWGWCLDWKKLVWKKRPARALLFIGAVVTLGVLASEILIFESSTTPVRNRRHGTAMFPILVPIAVSFAFACKWQGSAAVPNFVGFFSGHVYISARDTGGLQVRVFYYLILSLITTLEAQIGADILRRNLCRHGRKAIPTIDTVHECLLYFVIIGVVTLAFETTAAVAECTVGYTGWSSFGRFWSTRWLGALAGLITIAPFLIHAFAYGPRLSRIFRSTKVMECFLLVICTVSVMGLVIFSLPFTTVIRPLPYLLYPLVIFSVFRFNRLGWTIVVAAISFFGAWGSLRYKSSALYYTSGSSARSSPTLILQIQLFMSVLGMVAISLAGAVREKKQLTKDLHNLNHRLEEKVSMRTQELIRANNDLQISQAHAEKANLAKSDFLANMSHEIRTPIHGILGLTALLLQSELTADQLENLSSVKDCADLLLHIINSILDLAKIEAGRLEVENVPYSIRKVVVGTLRMMQVRAKERGLQLLWKVDVDVPALISGDPGKLQQCLLNLVGNALKFTHQGSVWVHISLHPGFESSFSQVLSVRKELVKRSPRRVPSLPSRLRSWASWPSSYITSDIDEESESSHVPQMFNSGLNMNTFGLKGTKSSADNGSPSIDQSKAAIQEVERVQREYVLIEVSDTGIGMSEDSVREMFNPFTQADASTSRLYGGTGLGLSIVQRFVELLGGKIWVESEIGKGSMFSFVVPFQRVDSKENLVGGPQFSLGLQPVMGSFDKQPRANRQTNMRLPSIGKDRRAHSLNTLMKNLKFTLPQFSDVEPLLHAKSLQSFKDFGLKTSSPITSAEVGRIGWMVDEGLGLADIPGPSHRSSGISRRDGPGLQTFTSVEAALMGEPKVSDSEESQVPEAVVSDSLGLGKSDSMQPLKSFANRLGDHSNARHIREQVPNPGLMTTSLDGYCDLELGIVSPGKNLESSGLELGRMITGSKLESLDINMGGRKRNLSDGPSVQAAPHSAERDLGKSSDTGRSIQPEREQGQSAMPQKKSYHVLLAEDNMINQKVATRQLQKHGHTVSIVGDGLQALNAVRSNHDKYDLVLMDIQMPMMDGLEATQKIREEETMHGWKRLPILGLTAHAISGYQETCYSHGMDAYLGKPFDINQLLQIINKFV